MGEESQNSGTAGGGGSGRWPIVLLAALWIGAALVDTERHGPIPYWLMLPAGLLPGVLTLCYLGIVLSGRERLERLVAERTAELGQTQERLRTVLDAIPVRVHWKDRDSVYLGCNRRFAEDAGLKSPEAIVGKTDFDLPWKEDAELYRERDRKVVESGQPLLDSEQPRRASDGRVLWMRQSKLPLRDAQGHTMGVLSTSEDITTRKQAEEALRESEARYRAVVEYSPDGMVVSLDGKVVYVNPATVRLAGAREAAEMLGHSILEFVPEDYQAEVGRRVAKMLETGLPAPVLEGKLRRLDGRIIEADFMGVPIVYGGKPAILSSFRDMTEHRHQAQALQAVVKATTGSGEEFFRALVAELGKVLGIKCALVGVLLREVPGRVRTVALWLQGALVENCEYELADSPCANVVGKQLCHYPSDVQSLFPRDQMLADIGVVSYLGVPLYSSSGAALGLLCVMDNQPMPNSELAKSLITIFAARASSELEREEALKELRQSREQLRERAEELEIITENAPVVLWVAHDPQCNAISGNRMAGDLDQGSPPTNWSANVPGGLRWFRDGRQLQPQNLPMQEAARTNTEIQNAEMELLLPSGKRVSLFGSATPLRDGQGRVRGCVGAFLDITERNRAEAALRQARDELARANTDLERKVAERTAQLVEANANLENFAYTAAHDLRAPLRGITSFAQILAARYNEGLDEMGRSMVARVVDSAEQMGHLLNDLLEYSKISQGDLQLEKVKLEEAVREVLGLLESDIRAKQAEVSVAAPLPEVMGHPATVVMLICNLVSNGLKFMPKEVKPQLRIRADAVARADCPPPEPGQRRFVRLWVEDNGIGIAPEDQGKVFGAFQRLHAKGTYAGTGLGLAIVRKGVERMGGRVGVESELGKGSRFWLELVSVE